MVSALAGDIDLRQVEIMRAEEGGRWRHPVDLVGLMDDAIAGLPELGGKDPAQPSAWGHAETSGLAWAMLGEDPRAIVSAICSAVAGGATPSSWAVPWPTPPLRAQPVSRPKRPR